MKEPLGYLLLITLAGCNADGVDHQNDISVQQRFAFEAMDSNHNGEIDPTEWGKEADLSANEIASTDKQQATEYRKRLKDLFTELDINKNGALSKSELIVPKL